MTDGLPAVMQALMQGGKPMGQLANQPGVMDGLGGNIDRVGPPGTPGGLTPAMLQMLSPQMLLALGLNPNALQQSPGIPPTGGTPYGSG